jgi:rhamnosyltransferase
VSNKIVYPRVAVLLAAYNGLDWIRDQLKSIFIQIEVDLTIFISVDLSNDKTYEYCLSLSQNDDRVVVLKYGERFGGAGKNFYRLFQKIVHENCSY